MWPLTFSPETISSQQILISLSLFSLQKFKLMTANTVISQENSAIETMATDQVSKNVKVSIISILRFYFDFISQLLDLFVLEDASKKEDERAHKREDVGGIVGAYKNVLENMPELWEDKLYEEEYDLSSFIKNLAK